MARILLAYSTVDGHTRSICERVRALLEDAGHAVTLASLGGPQRPDAGGFDKVVIGASIRYGKHRPEVFDFIRAHRQALDTRPSAFFTVNAVARKPGKDTAAGNPYVQSFRRKSGWAPALVGVFAGRIDYRKYDFLDRQIIRFIMWLTHGPTDPRACVEFTDWDSVEAFAQRVSGL
jgi:menaquinone-dependent protoporphyrinogen oxidase